MAGRSGKRDREQIRSVLGFRRATVADAKGLAEWLRRDVLTLDHKHEHLQQAALDWCRRNRIEPPPPARLERIIRSALKAYEDGFFAASYARIPTGCRCAMDALLQAPVRVDPEATPFSELRADPGRASLESVLNEIAKLRRIVALGLPEDLFAGVPPKVLQKYRRRAASEQPRELRMHPEPIRYTLMAAFCWQRRKEIIDGLVDLLIQIVHRIGARAERKVVKALLEDLRKVHGKTALLYRIAEAAVENPDGIVKEVLYPIAGEQTLRDLVREFKATGPAYQREVHTTLRSSYGNHYRRMLSPLLEALTFRSNNASHRPVIDAIAFLKARRESRQRYFTLEEGVPIDGVVRSGWKEIVLEKDKSGTEPHQPHQLRDRRPPGAAGAAALQRDLGRRSRPLPQSRRGPPLGLRGQAGAVLRGPRATPGRRRLRRGAAAVHARFPRSPGTGPAPEPEGQDHRTGQGTPLGLPPGTPARTGQPRGVEGGDHPALADDQPARRVEGDRPPRRLHRRLPESSPREAIDRKELQKRLLLCLYGLGTNTGLKRVSASDPDIGFKDLLYVRRKFCPEGLPSRRHRQGGQRHLRGPPPRDLGRGDDRLRLRLQEVRGLGPEPHDRVARPLRRPGRDDLLARRAEVGVHLLAAETLLLLGGRRDDRGGAAPLHGDGGREELRR